MCYLLLNLFIKKGDSQKENNDVHKTPWKYCRGDTDGYVLRTNKTINSDSSRRL